MEEWRLPQKSLINRLRNKIRFLLRRKRKEWALNILESVPPNPCGFWKAINRISGGTFQSIPTLIRGDDIAVSDSRKADLLSEAFQQNFNASHHPRIGHLPGLSNFEEPGLEALTREISAAISKMNSSAPGNDGVPPAYIKALKDVLAEPIAVLLLKCLHSGCFPKILKTARVFPIPKVPGSTDPMDFRPITVTAALSKVLEHWILSKIRSQIEPADFQFGFRRHSGTDSAIACLQHLVAIGLDACPAKARALVISFDIFRAFDQVSHNLLLKSLQDRAVSPPLLALISSFLHDRSQFVQVGSAQSVLRPVLSGVCQGTVIGPALFNVFVDKIFATSSLSHGASIIMYADDLCYIKPLLSVDSEKEAQCDVNQLLQLYKSIGLCINPKKSQQLLVSASNQKLPSVPLQVDGTAIAVVKSLRYLGVTLDSNLSFGLHARLSACKAKQQLGALFRRIGRWVPSETFLRLVKQKVLPQLTYALPVVATSNKGDWRQLEGVLRFALRLVSNDYVCSYCDLLNRYNMVPIARIYMEHSAALAYKFVYGLRHFPLSLFSQFALPAIPSSTRITRNSTQLRNTAMRLESWNFTRSSQRLLETCTRLPIYRLLHLWNLLDDKIICYGLNRFRTMVSDADDLFDKFCSHFKYRNTVIYSVFQDM